MSTIPDAGACAGTNPPPCPDWCGAPSDHDLPVLAAAGQTFRREHVRVVLDDPALAYIAVLRSETVIHPAGPAMADQVLVHVEDVPAAMTADQVHEVVHSLAFAEILAQAIDRDPDVAAPMALAGWPATAETTTVLSDARTLIVEHLHGPGIDDVVARIDAERARLVGGR
ncbi:hypothetical protein [Pseudonocardia sp. ICBG601]|uniref:hypothetical protein n=1 Tax=Pseudonocardia sp. ICBG601 TaxID=2846759 RepID=UPI001CF67AE8|nr:hypothetical protein [Pseudonocardia sp. ICBG601]